MSYQQHNPHVGATFVPGGFDDYYLPAPPPELISPSPQRIMPEVPEQMQDQIAHLELDANETQRMPQSATPAPNNYHQPGGNYNQYPPQNTQHYPDTAQSNGGQWPATHRYSQASTQWAEHNPPQTPIGGVQPHPNQNPMYQQSTNLPDLPNFSPFPKIQNLPNNVPPSYDDKETILENARLPVLNSNNPEMQLAWAQDALDYCWTMTTYEARLAESQAARPVTPQVEHQLKVDAMNIVTFLADQHHPKAEFMKGIWLEFGKFGYRIDKKEAFRCYARAADKGYSRAEYRMGMQYEQSNDPIKALVHYKRGAEQNDSASNYRLGMMTLLGQAGQQQDFQRGIQLLRLAANSVDENAPQGAYVMGMLQARELPQVQVPELFLPFDEKLARVNIEKAAFLGFAKAQVKMGQAYELCTLGCDFNPALSLHYNALAARQGEPEAEMAISKWFLCGYDGVFQKSEELAFIYANRAALSGLATAEFAMGYYNEIGMHTPRDLAKATEWYEKAAAQGNKDAASRIESIKKQNTLSKKDHEDVAISRIKSQYGSKRGSRPERFTSRTPAPPLPTVQDEREDTPDLRHSSASMPTPQLNHGMSDPAYPSRNSSTTPYPLDDRQPLPGNTIQRPATTTPYPSADNALQPGGRQGPAGGFFAHGQRPLSEAPPELRKASSAFNINPNLYGPQVPPSRQQQLPLRPYSETVPGRNPPPNGRPGPNQCDQYGRGDGGGYGPAGGRGGRGDGQGDYGRGDYGRSDYGGGRGDGRGEYGRGDYSGGRGDYQGDYGGGRGGRGDYPGPGRGEGRASPRPDGPPAIPGKQPQQQPPRIDIGYVAPLEIKKPKTQTPTSGPGGGPGFDRPPRGDSRPAPNSGLPPNPKPRIPSGADQGRQSAQPDRKPVGSRPSTASPAAANPAAAPAKSESKPAAKPAAATKPAAGGKTGISSTPAPTKPPGKGPKTFNEMGIPAQTKNSDCTVM
ncbi:hypothetical protein K402DRAFT_398982 [Aulographum hederae CBS 113979]|uniref:HCP-like protein n=1 Tax=Aulographum hederae CBS 113979 TaxID=1176131 RepID=A0A6G1GJD1_9PEZI|nr:hypothetical protein K402DRAFT_398982 [Aulographum hederae CBS 113979]